MPPTTSKTILTGITIIYFTIVMVVLMFNAVVLFLLYSGKIVPDVTQDFQLLKYAAYGITPIGIAAGYFVFKKMISRVESSLSLRDKLNRYQQVLLVRAACLEMPALLATVVTFMSGDLSLLVVPGLIVVVMLSWRPTLENIAEQLQLNEQERMKLGDPEGRIE